MEGQMKAQVQPTQRTTERRMFPRMATHKIKHIVADGEEINACCEEQR